MILITPRWRKVVVDIAVSLGLPVGDLCTGGMVCATTKLILLL